MRRIITVCAVLLLLVGCAQKDPFEDLSDGECTRALVNSVNKHISGQIDAFAEKDWELAHSFASENFQSNVPIEDFTFIIAAQYQMLITNTGYEFNECTVAGSTITQEVTVISGEQMFGLAYELTVIDSTLGIESAKINIIASQVNV